MSELSFSTMFGLPFCLLVLLLFIWLLNNSYHKASTPTMDSTSTQVNQALHNCRATIQDNTVLEHRNLLVPNLSFNH